MWGGVGGVGGGGKVQFRGWDLNLIVDKRKSRGEHASKQWQTQDLNLGYGKARIQYFPEGRKQQIFIYIRKHTFQCLAHKSAVIFQWRITRCCRVRLTIILKAIYIQNL